MFKQLLEKKTWAKDKLRSVKIWEENKDLEKKAMKKMLLRPEASWIMLTRRVLGGLEKLRNS